MLLRFADNRDSRSWASRARARRIQLFERLIAHLPDPVRVLDVGGAPSFWRSYLQRGGRPLRVTLLNLDGRLQADGFELIVADARDLHRFADASFHACFSNSLIEHVGTFYDQQRAAREMARVAPVYMIQTPHRGFPLEPHFLLPAFQHLPLSLRAVLHQRLKLGWVPAQPDAVLARAEVEQIRLLSRAEMQRLFPDARVLREAIGPLTKSWIAVRSPQLERACPGDRL
jgi:hypothetical protein